MPEQSWIVVVFNSVCACRCGDEAGYVCVEALSFLRVLIF
jgi:hypothetical protein